QHEPAYRAGAFVCRPQQRSGAGTANRTRATCLPCTGSATELCQRSWRGDSNADHGLTRPALFPLSYTSTKFLEVAGRIALPHDLLCRQTPCCLGYATSNSGAEYGNCTRASGLAIRGTAPIRTPPGASSESRTRVIGLETRGTSRYTMLALL